MDAMKLGTAIRAASSMSVFSAGPPPIPTQDANVVNQPTVSIDTMPDDMVKPGSLSRSARSLRTILTYR